MATVATQELVWLAAEWEALYRSAVISGIVGDYAHQRQGGYHISRQDNPAGNYSVVRPDDRAGPSRAAAAIDMSMNAADMKLCTARLRRLFDARDDPRRRYLNAFNGWDGSASAARWDFVADVVTWATDDHKWHVHLEIKRRFVESMPAMRAIRSGLAGESAEEDDDVKLTDRVKLVAGKDVKYSAPHTTVEGVLASTNYYVLQSRSIIGRELAEAAARQKAILEAVTGGKATEQTIRREFERFRAELTEQLAPTLADAVRVELTQVPAAEIDAAMERALRNVLAGLAAT